MSISAAGAAEGLNELGAAEAARRIARGELTSTALVEACLARIAAREPVVGAWQFIDPDGARAEARRRDAEKPKGALHGVPIGVKDIFDTADMPTTYGSPIYAGHRPQLDAAAVMSLRAAGAVILGKTVTTEFAYFTPGKTANPHDPTHTPGGSSSGSAAAVADGMVPAALGTQTAGSVIRPAAYCGVVGFKPSHRRIDISGAKSFAPSLDTVGVLARQVEDVDLIGRLLWGENAARPELVLERPKRVGFYRTHYWGQAEHATRAALERVLETLRHHHVEVSELELPEPCRDLNGIQQTIMAFEARLSYGGEWRDHADQLSPKLRELLEGARTITDATFEAALHQAAAARVAFEAVFEQLDLIVTPSAPGEAPAGTQATGDPVFNRMWTTLHVPCLTLPAGEGPGGLPVGVQLVGRFRGDHELLAQARWLEAEMP
jgi:amidase